jgi:uncharacterized protein YacL
MIMSILSSAQQDINHESIHKDLSFHICRKQQMHVHSDQGLHTNNGILQFDTASVTILATSIIILLVKEALAFLRWCMSGCLPESQSQTYLHTSTLLIMTIIMIIIMTIITTIITPLVEITPLVVLVVLVVLLENAMRNYYLILLAHGQTPTKSFSHKSSHLSPHSSKLLCTSSISCERP